MRIQQWSVMLFAAACWAQVPAGQPRGVQPVIPDNIAVEANIPYDSHKETVIDILRPKEKSKDKRPGVLLIHGGGWTSGTKEDRVAYAAMKYLEKGFVVANVEYRLAKTALAPAAVTDVLNAAQWFRKNAGRYGVDSRRIVVTGDSAGGHLALMVALTPKSARLGPSTDVAAVVNFYGIVDVWDQVGGPNMREYAVTWIPEQQGREDMARRVSPLPYARKDAPPVFTVHGDNDQTVPYEHGARITKALQDAGAKARLHTVPGHGHSMPKEKLDEVYEHVFTFLKENGVLR